MQQHHGRPPRIEWEQCRYNAMHIIPAVEINLHEKFCTISKSIYDQIQGLFDSLYRSYVSNLFILASMADGSRQHRHTSGNGKADKDDQSRSISVDSGYAASSRHISSANSQDLMTAL